MRILITLFLLSQIYQTLPPSGVDHTWYYREGAASIPAVSLAQNQIPVGWRKTTGSDWITTRNQIETTAQQFLLVIPISQEDVAEGELTLALLSSQPFAVAVNGQELVYVAFPSVREPFIFTAEAAWQPGPNLLQITLYPPGGGELIGLNFLRGTARYGRDRTLRDYRLHPHRINPGQEIY